MKRRSAASVEEHPKGSGRYRVRARVDGKISTIGSGLPEGEALELADAYARKRADFDVRRGLTVDDYGQSWLDRREGTKRIRSIHEDRNRWKNRVTNDPVGSVPIAGLRRRDITDWRDRMLKTLRPQSVKNALNLLRVCLDEAVEREAIKANPATGVRLPRGVVSEHELDLSGVLRPAEQDALLLAVPESSRPLVMFALVTGLRWAEQSWLRWEDVREGYVIVRRSRGGGPTKSGKVRRVPLMPPALAALAEQKNTATGPWVFPGADGSPRKYRPSAWRTWLDDAGIKRRVRWHDLRHTCGTSLVAGWWGHVWSLEDVRGMLGHSNVSTTERYAKILDETVAKAAEKTKFPGGNGSGGSSGKDSHNNGFLNRWSQVRLLPGAPTQDVCQRNRPSGFVEQATERDRVEVDRHAEPHAARQQGVERRLGTGCAQWR